MIDAGLLIPASPFDRRTFDQDHLPEESGIKRIAVRPGSVLVNTPVPSMRVGKEA